LIRQGDVVTYLLMCSEEGVVLRRGMNFKLRGGHTVVLMSQREGAPYADRVEEDGRVLIYEGHDIGRGGPGPKTVDQPETKSKERPTQNALFLEAVTKYKRGEIEPELVKRRSILTRFQSSAIALEMTDSPRNRFRVWGNAKSLL